MTLWNGNPKRSIRTRLTDVLFTGVFSNDQRVRDSCLQEAYAIAREMEGRRERPEALDDMLPMFSEWVDSGYASEAEWRLAIEVKKLQEEVRALRELVGLEGKGHE